MKIRYDVEKLQQIIQDFSVLSDISISFLDTDFNSLCRIRQTHNFCTVLQQNAAKKKLCSCSDNEIIEKCKLSRAFEDHICHAGLYDAIVPVIKNGIVVGYVLMGRVRCKKSPSDNTANIDLNELYSKMPYFSERKIESLKSLLGDIVFQNAITFDFDETIDKISVYISENLTYDLSVGALCSKFLVSKNYLYNGFKKYFGKTVNDYVTDLRLCEARRLITETQIPIYEVCEKVGINNYTYFCRLFKKKTIMSPTEYRKASRE